MEEKNDIRLPEEVKFIKSKRIDDCRGSLYVTDSSELPFDVKRVFWITNIPKNQTRGGHAHRICAEIIFPIKGTLDITTDDGTTKNKYTLDDPNTGIYIGPMVWCELNNFSEDCVCLVLASHPYIADGYIQDYKSFKAEVCNKKSGL